MVAKDRSQRCLVTSADNEFIFLASSGITCYDHVTALADIRSRMAASASEELLVEENHQPNASPKLTRTTINDIEKTETSGIPLNTNWTFWIDKSVRGTSAAQYEASLTKVYTVSTVQGFWSVYNNIPKVCDLSVRYTYHLMRHERKPVWEEDYHRQGGNWRLKCQKKETEEVWKELLLAAIGENLSDCMAEGDEVSGLTVSVREREDLIQIWTVKADLHEQSTIVKKIEELLPRVTFSAIFYKAFQTHQAFEGDKPNSKG
ncbi:hypothetical protein LSH36_52g02025 [Paralvinella palmiformis]|uniref:Eukaryotic translation initiation factor 4E type 3 n=1 Tax=Paralvinella palmiformis TaxID=53620 RepID=A0AAD9K779_9ANNE|nr:hypothetical protein LSH36_52g02025 [Paralvinella palmiformis]